MPRNILKAVFIAILLFPVASCADEDLNRFSIADKATYIVEIADTEPERAKGLMHRKSLDQDKGMLFVFPGEYMSRGFWMKDTLIPLDLIFMDDQGRISHIHTNARPLDETVIPSNGPTAGVLEVNAGEAENKGFAIGDETNFLDFSPKYKSGLDRQ